MAGDLRSHPASPRSSVPRIGDASKASVCTPGDPASAHAFAADTKSDSLSTIFHKKKSAFSADLEHHIFAKNGTKNAKILLSTCRAPRGHLHGAIQHFATGLSNRSRIDYQVKGTTCQGETGETGAMTPQPFVRGYHTLVCHCLCRVYTVHSI